jgi:hypothetical protein
MSAASKWLISLIDENINNSEGEFFFNPTFSRLSPVDETSYRCQEIARLAREPNI